MHRLWIMDISVEGGAGAGGPERRLMVVVTEDVKSHDVEGRRYRARGSMKAAHNWTRRPPRGNSTQEKTKRILTKFDFSTGRKGGKNIPVFT